MRFFLMDSPPRHLLIEMPTEIEVANPNLCEHASKLAETMATRRKKMGGENRRSWLKFEILLKSCVGHLQKSTRSHDAASGTTSTDIRHPNCQGPLPMFNMHAPPYWLQHGQRSWIRVSWGHISTVTTTAKFENLYKWIFCTSPLPGLKFTERSKVSVKVWHIHNGQKTWMPTCNRVDWVKNMLF